ncbi:MAG TPA: hypothetical protein VM598_05815, partial [Bdellovibrionota bacterium]|nr:hypothetical protein [Bdellovibrionota bacterium]
SLVSPSPASAGEADAELISERIQAYHMPDGVVGEARFTSPTSTELAEIHDGDGAIWTGHYLAAEAYRYAVTRSPRALELVRKTMETMKALCRISGNGRLVRTIFAHESPYRDWSRQSGTWHRTTYEGKDLWYISYVTRDQYVGAFLGLGAVYDLVDDEEMRSLARDLVTGLVEHLIKAGWILIDRDAGRWIETYVGRYDQMLSVLQLAKHVNPGRFAGEYDKARKAWSWLVDLPIELEQYGKEGSYFRYNLDYGYMFNLIRLEQDQKVRDLYLKSFAKLRKFTEMDINPHFNLIDFALRGPNEAREAETRQAIEDRLTRGFRDHFIDHRGTYEACEENVACQPIPILERVYADFMWQRTARHLYGGGDGSIQGPGIDYILPYWMARYYGVIQ